MGRWKCHPGYVPLSYVVKTTDVSERRFYTLLREQSPVLHKLGHTVEAHGSAIQHVFLQSAVDRYARRVRRSLPPAPAAAAEMRKRFEGKADAAPTRRRSDRGMRRTGPGVRNARPNAAGDSLFSSRESPRCGSAPDALRES